MLKSSESQKISQNKSFTIKLDHNILFDSRMLRSNFEDVFALKTSLLWRRLCFELFEDVFLIFWHRYTYQQNKVFIFISLYELRKITSVHLFNARKSIPNTKKSNSHRDRFIFGIFSPCRRHLGRAASQYWWTGLCKWLTNHHSPISPRACPFAGYISRYIIFIPNYDVITWWLRTGLLGISCRCDFLSPLWFPNSYRAIVIKCPNHFTVA